MCGIYGFFSFTKRREPDQASLARMGRAIVHRGPDDEGRYCNDGIALGMRRLSIIDLDGGHQPIANEDKTVWVVCNGEIYNFKELRRELETLGHRFASSSDTEVIVHAYEEWGDRFLDRIDGMFGVAVWDARKRRLVLARDRMGIKPLYYSVGRRFAFSSEVKSLLEVPGVSVALDEDGLTDHLTLGYAVPPNTVFRGIKKLGPGERLIWESGNVSIDEYWRVPTEVRADLT